jgi:hypothetical protein
VKKCWAVIFCIFAAAFVFLSNAAAEASPRKIEISLGCQNPPVRAVDGQYGGVLNYNNQLVSAAYGVFAAASSDAYANSKGQLTYDIAMQLRSHAANDIGWRVLDWNKGHAKFKSRYENSRNGLLFDTYYRDIGKCVIVLVAYRGTDGFIDVDTISNLSYLTGFLPFKNQYDDAREQFSELKAYAVAKFGVRKVHFVTTGHSLGGGLAIHVAYCFPKVSAVVFDPSFVENKLKCKGRDVSSPYIYRIYETGEPFDSVRRIAKVVRRTDAHGRHRAYRINSIELDQRGPFKQHNMLRLSAGLLRIALDCRVNQKGCEIDDEDIKKSKNYSHVLYCRNFIAARKDNLCK